MDKTKAIISAHQESHKEFLYYFSVIEIAEESMTEKPDVTIDCCKSLIEGISKSILIRLDNNYNKNNHLVDTVKASKLFDKAITLISKFDQSLSGKETDFLAKSKDLVETIINIRNDRGDISHGKFTPKATEIISTSEFALFVINMTDSIISFMLKVFFDLKIPVTGILAYDSNETVDYNKWLDESIEFPIKTVLYSKLLYENDYNEYEDRYYGEFKPSQEVSTEVKELICSILDSLTIHVNQLKQGENKKQLIDGRGIRIEPQIEIAEAVVASPKREESKVQFLVTTFNEETFWTEHKLQALLSFSEVENLKNEELKKVINDYLFTEKIPLKDDIANSLIERPKLAEFKTLIPSLTTKITAFADELNTPEV